MIIKNYMSRHIHVYRNESKSFLLFTMQRSEKQKKKTKKNAFINVVLFIRLAFFSLNSNLLNTIRKQ